MPEGGENITPPPERPPNVQPEFAADDIKPDPVEVDGFSHKVPADEAANYGPPAVRKTPTQNAKPGPGTRTTGPADDIEDVPFTDADGVKYDKNGKPIGRDPEQAKKNKTPPKTETEPPPTPEGQEGKGLWKRINNRWVWIGGIGAGLTAAYLNAPGDPNAPSDDAAALPPGGGGDGEISPEVMALQEQWEKVR